jgi:hypothetical protein
MRLCTTKHSASYGAAMDISTAKRIASTTSFVGAVDYAGPDASYNLLLIISREPRPPADFNGTTKGREKSKITLD